MPQTCSVCKRKRLAKINRELITGTALRSIAKHFPVSPTALFRHKQAHVPTSLALAKEHQDTLSAQSLLSEMVELKDRLRHGLKQAEAAGNAVAFMSFAREFRQCLESYLTISEWIAEKARTNGEVEIHIVYDTPDGKPLGYAAAHKD